MVMSLDQIDLNLLVSLARLLEARSVTEAARRAGVGQPAMSRTLARLRALFADPLLTPVGRSLRLTPRALELRPRVDAALAAARHVLEPQVPFAPAQAEGIVRIAASDYVTAVWLGPWVVRLRAIAPGLQVRIAPVGLHSVQQLAQGELDMVLGPALDAPGLGLTRFVAKKVFTDELASAVRRGHPCLRRPWNLAAFVALDHVLVATDRPAPAAVDRALEKRGQRRRVAAALPSFLLVPALVAATDLVATMPRKLLETIGHGLELKRPPLTLRPVDTYLVWHPRLTSDPRHRFLRTSLAEDASAR